MATRFTTNPILHPLRMMILSYIVGLVSCVALSHFQSERDSQAAQGHLDSKAHAPIAAGIGALNDNSTDEAVTTDRPSPVDTSRHDAWQRHRLLTGRTDTRITFHRDRKTLVDLGVRLQI